MSNSTNLVEFWNFDPMVYPELSIFKEDIISRYPYATVVDVTPQALNQGNYSIQDKVVLVFTAQQQLNEAASRALTYHDRNRTKVILHPMMINTGGIPSVVTITRDDIIKELIKSLGNSTGFQMSMTPSALGSYSKMPVDQREQAKPIGLYIFKSKNKEFNHRMNEVFYNFKESPAIEFDEIRRLPLMQQRPNKYQLLVVCSSDMDLAYQDLYQIRSSDNGRLITVLFNTTTEYDDPRNQYDFITSDKDVIEDQLRILISRIPANAKGSMLLPTQEYYNNSVVSHRGLTSNIALAQQSVLSRSVSPGMRTQSSRRLSNRPTSIIMNNSEPHVYVMDFHDIGYKQFYSMLPVNYTLVSRVPTVVAPGQKTYLIVPAAMATQVLNSLPNNEPNLRIIMYGEMATAQPHPSVELVSNDIQYIKQYLANNRVRIDNNRFGESSNILSNNMIQSIRSPKRMTLVPPGRQDLNNFHNASNRQTIRSSHLAGAPFFGVPSTNQITYVNPSINVNSGVYPSSNLLGSRVSLARLHSADNRTGPLVGLDRPRSVNQISRLINSNHSFQQLPIPNQIQGINTSVTTLNQSKPQTQTTKTITTQQKPTANRMVEQTVTTTTIQPIVLQVPIVTKIINQTITQPPPPPPLPIPQIKKEQSRVIITEIPYPVIERHTIDINTEAPMTTEYITQTSSIMPRVTTTVKKVETESIGDHNHLAINSTLSKKIGRNSRVTEYRTTEAAVPEVEEIEASMRKSNTRTSRVIREEIRVHPPDASAAIVQEIRQSGGTSYDRLSPMMIGGTKLQESTLNILNNSRSQGSRVHYKLDTPTTPVTTYVKEYVESNVQPSILVDHVIDQRVRVIQPTESISSVRVTETVPSRISRVTETISSPRVSHLHVRETKPVFDHVRLVEPRVKEYTKTLDTSRFAELKTLSPHTDLKDYERRVENGIQIFTKRTDRSFSTGKTVENTYSTDYSPKQYISSQVNSIEVPSPQIDSQTTINRHVVRNGVNLDEMATLIDKRNSMDYPRDLSNSISSTQYVVTSSTEPRVHTTTTTTYNQEPIQANTQSIYFQSGGKRQYVVVPQSGRVRELSESERRIRKRSGSLRSSRVQSAQLGTLYLIPESRKYLSEQLYQFIQPKDKVQTYYLNEDLKFVRYSEYGVVFVFPIDEALVNLPGVMEHSNAYIIKQARMANSPKEIRISRIDQLVNLPRSLLMSKDQQVNRQDVQLIFKKSNQIIDQVSDRFYNYQVYKFFSMNQLQEIIAQLDPQRIAVLVVDDVPEIIERFRNFVLFSCVVIPRGKHNTSQKARYPKLKWIFEDDIDLICDDIRQEIHRLSSKENLQKSYLSLKGSAPRLISYYEDTDVQDNALGRLQNRMALSQYHDHSSLIKRIYQAASNKKVVVLNPQFAKYANEIDAMAKGEALIIIYDKLSNTSREHIGNPKVRVARHINQLIEQLQIYLQYGN